ncbi:hypothetical protein, partial [Chlamydia trachomatis]
DQEIRRLGDVDAVADYIGDLLIEAFDVKFSAMLAEFTEIIGSAANAQG